jgi:phage gp36-like protein
MAYITVAELDSLGGDPDATSGFTDEEKLEAIEAVSGEADDHMRTHYEVPLAEASVSPGLKRHIANYVFANLMDRRGRSPNGVDDLIDMNRRAAIRYLENLSKGVVVLNIAAPTLALEVPAVYCDDSRGF